MKKEKPTSVKKPQPVELSDAERAELVGARDGALRWRYGVDPEVALVLKRLIDLTRQLDKGDPKGHVGAALWVTDVGQRVLEEALESKTDFLDALSMAIRRDASGLSTEGRFQIAYNVACLEANQDYMRRGERGEHKWERADEVCPSTMDVVEAYLRINPSAKRESAKTQIKRWVRQTEKRQCLSA